MDKDAFYFPHFSNARQDRKLRRVRKELDIEGYGIYFMLLEVLRDQKDLRYPMDDIDLLADEFGTSEQKVRVVICNYDLFVIEEINEEQMFFSSRLIEYMQPYLQAKERNRINGIKGNLIRYKHVGKEDIEKMTNDEILRLNESIRVSVGGDSGGEQGGDSGGDREFSQSKVKESKGKESKRDNSKEFSVVQKFEPEKDSSYVYDKKIVDVISEIDSLSKKEEADKNVLLALHIWNDVNNIRPNNQTTLKAKVKNWSDPVRLMIEQDDRTYEEIWGLWKAVRKDDFWRTNVLSTSKLREKFDALSIKLLNRKKNGQITSDDEIDQIIDSIHGQ